jgi:hypothetical protein
MKMTTDSFIYNPCDEEEDDMALACCHATNGDLFLLARFPMKTKSTSPFAMTPSTSTRI